MTVTGKPDEGSEILDLEGIAERVAAKELRQAVERAKIYLERASGALSADLKRIKVRDSHASCADDIAKVTELGLEIELLLQKATVVKNQIVVPTT